MKYYKVLLAILSALFIFHGVFYTDYVYLDEAYQLWNNDSNKNFEMFVVQGRYLTGLLMQKCFTSITSIDQLKLLRIVSLCGWMIAAVLWWNTFSKWQAMLRLNVRLVWLSTVFLLSSLPVAVYIGWASCMQLFLAFIAALLAARLLFNDIIGQQERIRLSTSKIILVISLGLTSLFFYQSAFGIFLLPFFLLYVKEPGLRPGRVVLIGIGFYLATCIVYYLLFRFSMQQMHMAASTRTGIAIDPMKKLSFFISGPLPQAFSFNILYNLKSLFSMIFYLFVLASWMVMVVVKKPRGNWLGKLGKIAGILLLCMLIYLPQMASAENFSSYRTMIALSLSVFIMLGESLLELVNKNSRKRMVAVTGTVLLVVMAYYNFNYQFLNPLAEEYRQLRKYISHQYQPGITTIVFIHPPEAVFNDRFGTKVYKDEFGLPSTFKDWTPEPLIKQMIFEQTGNRALAKQLKIKAYPSREEFEKDRATVDPAQLVMDMEHILKTTQ